MAPAYDILSLITTNLTIMNNKNVFLVPSIILSASIIVAVLVGASAFIKARGFDNALSVTGSATERVIADTAKWTFSFSRQATESGIVGAYSRIANDLGAARKFLAANNIKEEDITVTPVFTDEVYKYGSDQGGPRQFNVRQSVTVTSNDPKAMDALSKASKALSDQGVLLMPETPQYFYSKLSESRVKLLGAALTDARARATEIARSAGTKVGPLKAASSGVVQVLSPNSIDISDYGQYDTSSLEKDIMVTVRATFFVK